MGQQASRPQPGTKLQVIGVGMPRTGTASLSKALEILLDGPVYHGGSQICSGPEREVKTWIKVIQHWLNNPRDPRIRENIAIRLDGFVAITDEPAITLTKEMLDVYPDATVICTVRDVAAWEKSMQAISSTANSWFLRFILFPLPSLRYLNTYLDGMKKAWVKAFDFKGKQDATIYKAHATRLKAIVPADRLLFFDVKDGWEPLCKMLGKPIPSIPFPHVNDGDAINKFASKQFKRGLFRWAFIFTVTGATITALLWNPRRFR